jgi:ABC-type transport system involved in Fe-S cluster assembly fused permease/ATPase subunit
MKNLIITAIAILIVTIFTVFIEIYFKYILLWEEIKMYYIMFVVFIGLFTYLNIMAIIYDKKEKQKMIDKEVKDKLEQEEMNNIYRYKDQFPLGYLGIMALFSSVIVLLIYVVMNYRI